jgi:hypothetical protein
VLERPERELLWRWGVICVARSEDTRALRACAMFWGSVADDVCGVEMLSE